MKGLSLVSEFLCPWWLSSREGRATWVSLLLIWHLVTLEDWIFINRVVILNVLKPPDLYPVHEQELPGQKTAKIHLLTNTDFPVYRTSIMLLLLALLDFHPIYIQTIESCNRPICNVASGTEYNEGDLNAQGKLLILHVWDQHQFKGFVAHLRVVQVQVLIEAFGSYLLLYRYLGLPFHLGLQSRGLADFLGVQHCTRKYQVWEPPGPGFRLLQAL